MTRREAREAAFILIYERSFQNDKTLSKIIRDTSESQGFVPNKYIKEVVRGTEERLSEIDGLINESSLEWRIERMSAVSLSVLRLAVYEMLYSDGVPFRVAINEAVELAKKYDHEKAPAFINGILNRIATVKGLKSATDKSAHADGGKTDENLDTEKKAEAENEKGE